MKRGDVLAVVAGVVVATGLVSYFGPFNVLATQKSVRWEASQTNVESPPSWNSRIFTIRFIRGAKSEDVERTIVHVANAANLTICPSCLSHGDDLVSPKN